jgi:hypothetical protein
MEPWFADATAVASLKAEICFLLRPDFYFGPDRPSDPADLQRLVVPLSLPNIPRVTASMVRTSEAVGHEAELVSYFEQIVRRAREYRRPFNSIRHYFWLRFWLWSEEQEIYMSFPWYDSFSEIDRFSESLSKVSIGLVDHDLEQGWEMEVHSHNDTLFLREGDPDAGETHLVVSTPRGKLVAELLELRERTVGLITHLSKALGADVWTAYVREEPSFTRG